MAENKGRGIIPQEGHERPQLRYLNRHVRKSVASKWYDLGIELLEDDNNEELDVIHYHFPSDNRACCTKMFQLWLRQQPTASWNQLINSLRQPGVDLDHVATEIEQMLLQSKPSGHFSKQSDELRVFKKYYNDMMEIIPITSLSGYLGSVNIITPSEDEEVTSPAIPTEKVRTLLLKMSGSLEAGQTESFYRLLDILENFGNKDCSKLASKMRKEISFEKNVIIQKPVIDEGIDQYMSLQFSALVADIAEILDKSANLKKFKLVCCSITTPEKSLVFSEKESAAIQACNSVYGVFYELQDHWRWDSHCLLFTLIKRTGSQDAMERLKLFENKKVFAMKLKSLTDYFQSINKPPPPGYTRMTAILEKDYTDFSLDDCKELEEYTANFFGSSSELVNPGHWKKSNTIKAIQDSKSEMKHHLKELEDESLKLLGIAELEFGGMKESIDQTEKLMTKVALFDRIASSSTAEIVEVSDNYFDVSHLKHPVDNCTTMTLDLSENQMNLTEVIQSILLLRENTALQKLNICNIVEKFSFEVEFIIDVVLSCNSKLSEFVINGRHMRPRFSSFSKILSDNSCKNFSLQHLYLADKFPLYLSDGYLFAENFVICLDGDKKCEDVKEECCFDHAAVFTHYVDHRGGVYYYKDHDVALFIPPGAVLQNDCVEIKVSSSFYGKFQMPRNYTRISSFVWVGATNYVFKVPVYLIMNHFVDITSVRNIRTLSAFEACELHSSRNDDGILTMQEVATSYFDSHLKYCIISTNHFCTYCLGELKRSPAQGELQKSPTQGKLQKSLSQGELQKPPAQDSDSRKAFLATYYNYDEVEFGKGIIYNAEICCLYFNNNCFKTVKSQFNGRKPKYSKDFLMHSGQHLVSEYSMAESGSDWTVLLKPEEIKYNEFDFHQYSNNIDLLKLKEDLRIYPPRFKLSCCKHNAKSNALFNTSLSLKLMEDSDIKEEICSVLFITGQGNVDQSTVMPSEGLASNGSCYTETATDVLTTKPEMWDIIEIVFPMIKAEWQYVAYFMKYAPNKVSAFERDGKDSKGSCLKLFTDWLTTDNGVIPKNWLTLIEQIKKVDGLQQAAKDIEEKVKKLNS